MIRHLLPLVLLCFSIACQNQPAPKQELKQDFQKENLELITQFYQYFNSHDWENMANMYVENAEFKDPSFGTGIVRQSRADIIQKYHELNQIFPDLHDEVINTYPSGENHVIVEFISTGTAPDSSTFKLPICTIFTLEEGKITKDYTYYDNFEEGGEE
ncbi:MAG: nuclear transport factor 2 family protein [Bacteroidota bacterium]